MHAQGEVERPGWNDQRKTERVKLSLKLSLKSETPAGGQRVRDMEVGFGFSLFFLAVYL